MLLRNSAGKKDGAFTLLVISFVICSLQAIASSFEQIGPIEFSEYNAGYAATVFISLAALYWGRKFTDSRVDILKATPAAVANPEPTQEEIS